MSAAAREITILPLGSVGRLVLDRIRTALEAVYSARTTIAPHQRLPRSAWLSSRQQYDSTRLLLHIADHAPAARGKVLGVCDVDLCTELLTFVFGEAEVGGRFAVMSVHRLRPEVYGMPADAALYFHRAAKEAIHEIGHTFGLKHCFRFDCIMHASDSIEVTDLKRSAPCPSCAQKLANARKQG